MRKLSKRAQKQILNISVLVILIAATFLVLILSYRELNFGNILKFLASSNPWFIAAAFLCMLLFVVFEGLSLMLISRRLSYKGKVRSFMAYSSADIYYSAITPSASGGQPASAFYMVRDGMGAGLATFTLIFNLIAYTVAILLIGVAAFIMRPAMFFTIEGAFPKILIILGFVVQSLLLILFIGCMFCTGTLLKVGNGLISLLVKVRIVKKPEKWRKKLETEVNKYASCRSVFKTHRALFLQAVLLNVVQRVSQTLIPCLICFAADPSVSFADLFVMQAFVLLGYNGIPLPGGVGVYEYLYLRIYCLRFDTAFILSAMMVSRVISYYLCMIICGAYTLIYHGLGMRRRGDAKIPAVQGLPDGAENPEGLIVTDGAENPEGLNIADGAECESGEPESSECESSESGAKEARSFSGADVPDGGQLKDPESGEREGEDSGAKYGERGEADKEEKPEAEAEL